MSFRSEFGRWERLLHRFAFRTGFSQVMLADIEDYLFGRTVDFDTYGPPVFVSGLPRAGTTILLRLLAATDHFATHIYRDMPFVLCPRLWSRFSSALGSDDPPRERAHGDGIEVSSRSPEGFEEILWKRFWPDHYREDRIIPWSPTHQRREFDDFLAFHMSKIVTLRQGDSGLGLRYLSKNNVNFARLGSLPSPMRDGLFVVPYRDPIQHAASLLKQHRRFCDMQAEDPFVLAYMNGIGHYDFGRGLRPIDFGGWLREAGPPDRIEFWIRYWVAAYEHVLAELGSSGILIDYARLTGDPRPTLAELARATEIPEEHLVALASELRPPREHAVDVQDVSTQVRVRASEVLDRLHAVASRP